MEWSLGIIAIILLTVGLIGQAFEMRKTRLAGNDEGQDSVNAFANRRNFKWYALIGVGFVLWMVAERV